MAFGDKVNFRDERGRFRKARHFEKNEFWQLDGTLLKGIANFEFKTGDGIIDAVQKFAAEMVEYARRHAPWEDDTGDARKGLTAEGVATNDDINLILMHTVDYGIYLEVRNSGRFAIIVPTIESFGPKIYDHMRGICGEIVYYVD
jgi:hypothetical protein